MPTLYTTIFDATYYVLAGVFAVTLVATAITGLSRWRVPPGGLRRAAAMGVGWAALGTFVVLLAGVGFDVLSPLTGDLFYQQAHFSVFYVAFAFVLYGTEALTFPREGPGSSRRLRWVGRAAYGVSVALAAVFLYDPQSYTVTRGHVAQQDIFSLPLAVVLLQGAVLAPAMALRHPEQRSLRRARLWFGAFTALALIGALREATLIPSTGEPIVDLLVAFGPFTLGGVCLWLAGRSLRSALSGGVIVLPDPIPRSTRRRT